MKTTNRKCYGGVKSYGVCDLIAVFVMLVKPWTDAILTEWEAFSRKPKAKPVASPLPETIPAPLPESKPETIPAPKLVGRVALPVIPAPIPLPVVVQVAPSVIPAKPATKPAKSRKPKTDPKPVAMPSAAQNTSKGTKKRKATDLTVDNRIDQTILAGDAGAGYFGDKLPHWKVDRVGKDWRATNGNDSRHFTSRDKARAYAKAKNEGKTDAEALKLAGV